MYMQGDQQMEEQHHLQFQRQMASGGAGPMRSTRPVPISGPYPPQPHMSFHGEALHQRQAMPIPPRAMMQPYSPESQMSPFAAMQHPHMFQMHHGHSATPSPAPTEQQLPHEFNFLQQHQQIPQHQHPQHQHPQHQHPQHQHPQHQHPLQQMRDMRGACILPPPNVGWGEGPVPRMEINQNGGIMAVAGQNLEIDGRPANNTRIPAASLPAVANTAACGDAPKPDQASCAEPEGPKDPGMVLKQRFAAGVKQLNALRERRERLEKEVSVALEKQQESLMRSQELDERLARQNDAWERAKQREAAATRELATAREELNNLRSWLKMKAQMYEDEVESYGKELAKIIEKARVAPEMHETEHLKKVLETLEEEQTQQVAELEEIDVGLQHVKKEYTEILERDKNFSVCREEDIPTALMMLVKEVDQTVTEQEAESLRLQELEKKLLAEKDALLREKEQRERPLRAMFPRATIASPAITAPGSSRSLIHSTALLAKIPGQD